MNIGKSNYDSLKGLIHFGGLKITLWKLIIKKLYNIKNLFIPIYYSYLDVRNVIKITFLKNKMAALQHIF